MKYKAATTISIAAMVAIAFVACSADVDVALDETVTTEAEAPAEEQVDVAVDAGESENDADVEITTTTEVVVDSTIGESESPEDGEVEATSTTTPPPTTTSTTEPPAEEIAEELELLEIIGLGTAQQTSFGDRQLYFESYPDGLDRLKISVANADGYCSVRDYQITYGLSSAPSDDLFSQGFSVVFPEIVPDCELENYGTIGVAWVHVDGRRSGISFHPFCAVSDLYYELC